MIGGLHHRDVDEKRHPKTANYLKQIKPELIVPLQCSGLKESLNLQLQIGPSSVVLSGEGVKLSFFSGIPPF